MSDTTDWLPLYLRDHYAGATAGVRLFGRVANGHSVAEVRQQVGQLAQKVAEDRDALAQVMQSLGVRRSSLTEYAAVAGEFAGRFKPNGSLWHRSAGADVLELEALQAGVNAKALLWETLVSLSETRDELDLERLTGLKERALEQEETLSRLHEHVVSK
ncbi:hypothetical protein [Branchiibius sp. NY16-3462-2]|uniref:hypothetical protein n=1 Tax=Branchiibius sp. NY16-3462-2 TaxID=1807500 RepID=UPI0025B7AB37|nr:hypothetical protein [Branchiibius sp. NY16-3462-2]